MFPLLLLFLVGGAVAAAVSKSGEAASSDGQAASSDGQGASTPAADGPLPTPQQVTDQAIAGAASYADLLKNASAPAGATIEELDKRAKEVSAQRAQLEKTTLSNWDRDVDRWRDAINTGLAYTGIGAALVPFVYAGASIMKWGAQASNWIRKSLIRNGNAWSADWQKNMLSEQAWLEERHIIYRGFNPKIDTPRGWCIGLNEQNSPTAQGTTALRVSFQRMPTGDASRAMSAFDVVHRHAATNPFARASFAALQLAATLPNYGAGMLLPSEDVAKLSKSADPGERYLGAFQWCLVSAIAVGVAKDYSLPASAWHRVIVNAWQGWDKAARIYRDEWDRLPPAEWREGQIGVGYAGFPIAAAFAYAVDEAKKILGK